MSHSQWKFLSANTLVFRSFANFPFTKGFLEEECSEDHRKGNLQMQTGKVKVTATKPPLLGME
jgi:hypothetical protein